MRQLTKPVYVALLLLTMQGTLCARPKDWFLCRAQRVELSNSFGDLPVQISNHSFSSMANKETVARFSLASNSPETITRIQAVFRYVTATGATLTVVPYVSAANGYQTSEPWLIHSQFLNDLGPGLNTGRQVQQTILTNYLAEICPSTVILDYIQISWGPKSRTWSARLWETQPELNMLPRPPDFGKPLGSKPVEFQIQLQIGAHGKPTDMTQLDIGLPASVAIVLRRYVQEWEYFPALKSGKPVEATLRLLIRFQPRNFEALLVDTPSIDPGIGKIGAVVDFIPTEKESWVGRYGRRRSGTVLPGGQ